MRFELIQKSFINITSIYFVFTVASWLTRQNTRRNTILTVSLSVQILPISSLLFEPNFETNIYKAFCFKKSSEQAESLARHGKCLVVISPDFTMRSNSIDSDFALVSCQNLKQCYKVLKQRTKCIEAFLPAFFVSN